MRYAYVTERGRTVFYAGSLLLLHCDVMCLLGSKRGHCHWIGAIHRIAETSAGNDLAIFRAIIITDNDLSFLADERNFGGPIIIKKQLAARSLMEAIQ